MTLEFIGCRPLPVSDHVVTILQSQLLSQLGKCIYLTGKNVWFFIFERFGQSHVSKEWRSFFERLRILTMKDCRILLF